jgi:hypothetical protein
MAAKVEPITLSAACIAHPNALSTFVELAAAMPERRIKIARYTFGSQIVSADAGWAGFGREQKLVAVVLEGECELVDIAEPRSEMSNSQNARAKRHFADMPKAIRPIRVSGAGDFLGVLTLASLAHSLTPIQRARETWRVIAGRAIQSLQSFAPNDSSQCTSAAISDHIAAAAIPACTLAIVDLTGVDQDLLLGLFRRQSLALLENFRLYLQGPNTYNLAHSIAFKHKFLAFVASQFAHIEPDALHASNASEEVRLKSQIGKQLNKDMLRQVGAEVAYDFYLRLLGQEPLYAVNTEVLSESVCSVLAVKPRCKPDDLLTSCLLSQCAEQVMYWPIGAENFLLRTWMLCAPVHNLKHLSLSERQARAFAEVVVAFVNAEMSAQNNVSIAKVTLDIPASLRADMLLLCIKVNST